MTQNVEDQARRYNRQQRWLNLIDGAVKLTLLILLLVTGATRDLNALAMRLGGGISETLAYGLGLFFYLFVLIFFGKLAGAGMEYYAFRLERRYRLTQQKFGGWLWDECKGFAVSLLLSTVLVELLYFIIRHFSVYWWILCWGAFTLFFIVLAQLAPVVLFPIFYHFETLKDEELRQRLLALAKKSGTSVRGVYEWKLSEKSNKANAALAGLGRTRRIVISDTILNHYTPEEIEAVLAHELGHHAGRHTLYGMATQSLLTFAGFWVLKTVLRQAPYLQADFSNLPLIIAVAAVLSLLFMPLANTLSRHFERQSDRYACEATGSGAALASALDKLAGQNLADREPSRWVEILFHSHPAPGKRIAAAQKWETEHNRKPSK